jgi:hypothetical protein
MGLLPTKGLTLPLVSYGGSSLVVSCMCIGIIARIQKEIAFNEDISVVSDDFTKTKQQTSKENYGRLLNRKDIHRGDYAR